MFPGKNEIKATISTRLMPQKESLDKGDLVTYQYYYCPTYAYVYAYPRNDSAELGESPHPCHRRLSGTQGKPGWGASCLSEPRHARSLGAGSASLG